MKTIKFMGIAACVLLLGVATSCALLGIGDEPGNEEQLALLALLGLNPGGTGPGTGSGTGTTTGIINVSTTVGGSAGTPGQEIAVTILGPPNYNLTTSSGTVSQITSRGTYDVTCGAVSGYNVTGSITGQSLAAGGTLNVTCAYTVAGPLFEDDFEDGIVSDWTKFGVTGMATTTISAGTPAANGTTKGFKAADTNWITYFGGSKSLGSEIAPSSITFYMLGGAAYSGPGAFFRLYSGTTTGGGQNSMPNGTNVITIYCDSAWGGSSIIANATATGVNCDGTYKKVEITNINYTSHTYDILVQGGTKKTGVAFGDATKSSFNWIAIHGGGMNGSASFDEIKMMP